MDWLNNEIKQKNFILQHSQEKLRNIFFFFFKSFLTTTIYNSFKYTNTEKEN